MVTYTSAFAGGDVTLPPSKSAAHRALLCGALSRGSCVIENIDSSKDMEATLGAIRALGVRADFDRAAKRVALDASQLGSPRLEAEKTDVIDCLESGSTLRFLIPIAAALGGTRRFTGRGRLPQRPMGVYADLLPRHGVSFRRLKEAELPLEISGQLVPGVYSLPGNVSSQFVTGLLFALPLLSGDSEIVLTSPLESEGYVELTLGILKDFGVTAFRTDRGWRVPGNQRYKARSYRVEGDWSQAAFFLCMAAVSPTGAKVRLHGLDGDSRQGDKVCVEKFSQFGLQTAWENGVLTVWNPRADKAFGGLCGQEIDVSQIPDMTPALAVCGALAEGETRLVNAGRLRLKESDRLAAMENALNALGGSVRSTPDSLILTGTPFLSGGTAQGCNDHRVVMALAAAALRCHGEVSVTDETSIEKSYPGFFEDYKQLGGTAHVVHVG